MSLLDSSHFKNRKDLGKDLEWGEDSQQLNKEQFKALMRIELRKSVSSQAAADIMLSFTYSCVTMILFYKFLIWYSYMQRKMLNAELTDPKVEVLSTLQVRESSSF